VREEDFAAALLTGISKRVCRSAEPWLPTAQNAHLWALHRICRSLLAWAGEQVRLRGNKTHKGGM
jgi:hypothetical protein